MPLDDADQTSHGVADRRQRLIMPAVLRRHRDGETALRIAASIEANRGEEAGIHVDGQAAAREVGLGVGQSAEDADENPPAFVIAHEAPRNGLTAAFGMGGDGRRHHLVAIGEADGSDGQIFALGGQGRPASAAAS